MIVTDLSNSFNPYPKVQKVQKSIVKGTRFISQKLIGKRV